MIEIFTLVSWLVAVGIHIRPRNPCQRTFGPHLYSFLHRWPRRRLRAGGDSRWWKLRAGRAPCPVSNSVRSGCMLGDAWLIDLLHKFRRKSPYQENPGTIRSRGCEPWWDSVTRTRTRKRTHRGNLSRMAVTFRGAHLPLGYSPPKTSIVLGQQTVLGECTQRCGEG